MVKIEIAGLEETLNGFSILCKCGKRNFYSSKNTAIRALKRENCKSCSKDYRTVKGLSLGIYKNENNKWCSNCPSCNVEQAYTRMDHAKQSTVANWKCKKCTAREKGFSNNVRVGPMKRLFNKFKKSALSRQIEWNLSLEDFESSYTATCALTGWDISNSYSNPTASFDRIDSTKSYCLGNIQWLHSMVNMSKNKYPQDKFIEMCTAIVYNINKL